MFGQLVRAHRQRLGLTQQELADKTGLAARSIRKLEAGRVQTPRPPTVRLLADVFGLTGPDRDRFCEVAAGVETGLPVAAAVPAPPPDASWSTGRIERPVPAQLPPEVPAFTGRDRELRRLDQVLSDGGQVVAITGTAGVGKTALVLHWAHRVAGRFPDGRLHIGPARLLPDRPGGAACGGGARLPRRLRDPARAGADGAGHAGRALPQHVGRQAGPGRPRQRSRRRSGAVAAPGRARLPRGGYQPQHADRPGRDQHRTPDRPRTCSTWPPARDLLVRRIGASRVAGSRRAVDDIVAACAGLPLALAIVAARAATNSAVSLEGLADELSDKQDSLDALNGGDPATDIRSVFSWSYRMLSPFDRPRCSG